MASFLVTNNGTKPIYLTGARLKKSNTEGQVCAENNGGFGAACKIVPTNPVKISLMFWTEPLFAKKGQIFTDDIIIVDNFGRQHKIKKVSFQNI